MLFKKKQIGGEIKYYGLTEWWLNNFTEEERDIIRKIYQPFTGDPSLKWCIDEGEYSVMPRRDTLSFLGILATWFEKPEYYHIITQKILDESEKYYHHNNDVIARHYFCGNAIQVYYRNRDTDEKALEKAIYYCKEQIKLAPIVEPIFLNELSPYKLPTHPGYKQLAIIYEKQGKYNEALMISKDAYLRGWNKEDCTKRITKLEKKIQSKK